MIDKVKVRRLTIILLIIITLGFIWGNSCVSQTDSAEGSENVFSIIKPIIDFLFGADTLTHGIFRKIVHFSEFFLLALEFNLLYVNIKRYSPKALFEIISIGLFVAVIDESLQMLSGRGPMVADVLIDFSGYVACSLVFLLIRYAILKRREQKEIKYGKN